ncbi:3'-5' exonuclease [Pacificibacter marinus]|uniref:DNA-directed DNA polymerase n=1 Tax=Pacificibacter marinus TaxID=658057 RepID=A0A1Y5TPS2_9RHOB|nr:exonuclease domain-containing protein [Pacificibacter marinus]SEL35007.1 DNA polymerase-3 subunit epsilon [Pacificibacter marinus]SLN69084.1 DNA polymerase III PolC-type [Pacificibacter marinus]
MQIERWSLRLRMFLFFAFLAGSTILAINLGLWLGYRKLGIAEALDGFIFAGIIAVFGVLGATVWVWILFDEHVAKPIQTLSGTLLARAQSDHPNTKTDHSARYLGDLSLAAQTVTNQLVQTRRLLAKTVAHETAELIETNEKLAALAAEIPFGILLVSGSHKIAFYNGAATDLCGSDLYVSDKKLGLGHSIFDILTPAPLISAYARLCAGDGGIGHVIPLTVMVQDGTQILSARMRLAHAPQSKQDRPAYVLTLDDTAPDQQRRNAHSTLGTQAIRLLADLGATLQTVQNAREHVGSEQAIPKLNAAQQELLNTTAIKAAEVFEEYKHLNALRTQTVIQVSGENICDAVVARLKDVGITLMASQNDPVYLNVDPDPLISLLTHTATRLSQDGAKALSMLITPEDTGVMIALGWSGEALYVDRLDAWLSEPIDTDHPQASWRKVLNDIDTDMWPEAGRGTRRVLKLPIAHAAISAQQNRRGATYDFDLLAKPSQDTHLSTALSDLTYVVFDTETTGLFPNAGDEICQVAAVRIVNGKVVRGETLDALVDPERHIPKAATKIHHITNEMVREHPTIDVVGRALHSFARGAVLVAHNAPFDMAFLHRHASRIGAQFDHPVIDTVLLSAVVFGQSQPHSLDEICTRLGINIPPDQRHTALGDTIATAQAFLKMLKMAEAKGITTFEDLVMEMKRHSRLQPDLNNRTLAD